MDAYILHVKEEFILAKNRKKKEKKKTDQFVIIILESLNPSPAMYILYICVKINLKYRHYFT
jgi:hypothetical protein